MTMKRILVDSRQNEVIMESNNEIVINHWTNPNTYADIVLDIFNKERCYDETFKHKEDLTVLDIGANIGLFALYIQSRAKSVYCLEPTPSHFEILKENTKNYNNIQPLNIALSPVDGDIDFYTCFENSTMNSLDSRHGEKIIVKGKKIGTLLNDLELNHVDFVKLDIEGSEMFAITEKNLEEVKDKIGMWFVEVHGINGTNTLENRNRLSDIFSKCGYSIEHYKHDTIYARKRK